MTRRGHLLCATLRQLCFNISSLDQRHDCRALSTPECQNDSPIHTCLLSCCTNQHSPLPPPHPSPSCLLLQKSKGTKNGSWGAQLTHPA